MLDAELRHLFSWDEDKGWERWDALGTHLQPHHLNVFK